MSLPAAENWRSDCADVAGTDKYWLARLAVAGELTAFVAHHDSASMSVSTAAVKYQENLLMSPSVYSKSF